MTALILQQQERMASIYFRTVVPLPLHPVSSVPRHSTHTVCHLLAVLGCQSASPDPPIGSPPPPHSPADVPSPGPAAPWAGCSGTAPTPAAPGSAPCCSNLASATDGKVPGVGSELLGVLVSPGSTAS